MASDYPGAIDGLAATHADIEDSVLAVQGELGVNPSGAAATVAARLAALDTTVDGKAATGAAVTDGQIPATIARDTEVAAAVTAHEGAADPHPGYLLESSATATYAALAGQDYTGTHDFTGATVLGIDGGGGSTDPVPAGTGVQYVLTTGSDAADGRSWQTAKATVAAAQTALPAAGGVIQLGAGTFNGRHAITKANVTLRGIGWATILRLPDATNVTAQTLTIAADNAIVEHLKVDGNRGNNTDVIDGFSDSIGVWANNSTVQHVWITGARSHGYIVWGDATSESGGAANATVAAGERSKSRLLNCLVSENGNATDNRASVDWAFVSGTGVAPVDSQAVGNVVICSGTSRTCFTSHSSKRLLIHNNILLSDRGAGRMIELHTGSEDVVVSDNLFIGKGLISDAIRLRGLTRGTITGNHFRGDGVGNNRIQAAVFSEVSNNDHLKIVNNTLQDGPSFTGATLLKIVAGARVELIGNTLISHSGGGATFVQVSSGTVTTDQIKVRHNRGVFVDGVLSGSGAVDTFDNFGVGESPVTGGSTDPEVVRDTIATALVAGANVTITPDDTANTITIAASGGGTTDPEVVRDTIGATLVAGANVTITPNDGADTITIAATGGGGGGGAEFGTILIPGRYHTGLPRSSSAVTSANHGANALMAHGFYLPAVTSINALCVAVTTAIAGATLRLGIYNADDGGMPGTLAVSHAGTVDVSTGGQKEAAVSASLAAGMYWAVVQTGTTGGAVTRTPSLDSFFSLGRVSNGVSAAVFMSITRTDAELPASLAGTTGWGFQTAAPHGLMVKVA